MSEKEKDEGRSLLSKIALLAITVTVVGIGICGFFTYFFRMDTSLIVYYLVVGFVITLLTLGLIKVIMIFSRVWREGGLEGIPLGEESR